MKFNSKSNYVNKIFSKIYKSRNFSHAYMIDSGGGNEGVYYAKLLSKIILDDNGCKTTNVGRLIDNNEHIDFEIIIPENNIIKKEQLLFLQNKFNKKPIVGDYKVYIINEAEKMNLAAANCILKFLEEPNIGIVAILVTNNKYEVIPTIVSRCQIISLNDRMVLGKITSNNLKNIFPYLDDDLNYDIFINNLIEFVCFHCENKIQTLCLTNKFFYSKFKDKRSIYNFISVCIFYYKDILNLIIGQNIDVFVECKDIKKISSKYTCTEVLDILESLNYCKNNILGNLNTNLLIDKMIIDMGC